MVGHLKKMAFLVPKPGMSNATFRSYWRNNHGPLVAMSPGYGAWRRRYAQHHVLARGPIGNLFTFAGMASFRLPDGAPNEDAYARTALYRDRVRVDELKFIDMDRTVSMTAVERTMLAGTGSVQVVILSARDMSVTDDEFRREVGQHYCPAVLANGQVASRLRGWRVNMVLPDTFRLPGARAVEALAVDCIDELSFDTTADAEAAFAALDNDQAVRAISDRLFDPGSRVSFYAEELVYFDDGVPTERAKPSTPAE